MLFRGTSLAVVALVLTGCSAPSDAPSEAPASVSQDNEKVIKVEDQDAFAKAVAKAAPGDQIMLADGSWNDFDILFEATGTAEAPITLMAETPGKVILSGQSSLRIAGEHLVVSGLVFKDGYTPRNEVISFRKDKDTLAYNSRVTATVIDGYSNPDRTQRDLWVGLYGKNNVFDSNHLSGKMNAGPTLAVRLNTEESQQNRHKITNNYFGPRPIFGSNGGETFRIGTSHYSMTDSLTVVENNFFDRCSGEVEIISSKSGGNILRGNTFYASRGTLTLRHGNGTLVENNLFDGANAPYTGGVRVINANQTVQNNYFKDLTGNRFSGALVIMNGVPNSPINRYHQVDGAIVQNNTFENVAAIELGEGSDAERTATPTNSVFKDNVVVGRGEKSPINLYDDMSGIAFSGNSSPVAPLPAIESGFTVTQVPVEGAGASGDFGVEKDATGVSWYPKPSDASAFEGGRAITLEPGTDVLVSALKQAQDGDLYTLAPGVYRESKIITLDKAVTIKSDVKEAATLSFERPNLFVLTGHGGLILDGVTITGASAPDGKGNSFISTNSSGGSGNHILALRNVSVEKFDVNGGFAVVSATKGSFFHSIDIEGSTFDDVSGTVFKLDEETDDYGIYNAEYLNIKDSVFNNIGGSVAALYRGGRDESTFGPHANISGSVFKNIGKGNAPLMILHGIQQGSFTNNTASNAQPIDLTFTTGLPQFDSRENTIDDTQQSDFATVTDLRNRD